MPSFRKPGADEQTIALTGDDIEPASIPGRDDSITRQRPSPRDDDDDASMRDRTVPFYNAQDDILDAPTGRLPGADPAFAPPPFPGAAAFGNKPNILTETGTGSLTPILPAQVMVSRVESVMADNRESAFAPISRFPPAMARGPSSTPTRPPPPPAPSADAGKAPAWVMGYLLLCAALTIIGLVVLFFERKMLGSASPF